MCPKIQTQICFYRTGCCLHMVLHLIKNVCMCFRNENIYLQVRIFSHSMLSMCLNALLHEVHHDVFLKAPFVTDLILDTLF